MSKTIHAIDFPSISLILFILLPPGIPFPGRMNSQFFVIRCESLPIRPHGFQHLVSLFFCSSITRDSYRVAAYAKRPART